MELQSQILLFFSGIHNGFLNIVAQFFTLFGEELIPLAFAMFIFWNISKRKGFAISMSILTSINAMGVAKAIVRFPRPWTMIEGLNVVRQQTATGYSFPSGHTTTASSFFSAMAVAFRKRWFSIICAFMILMVGLSRMYLCVHWPMDVFGGLLIGCGVTFLLTGAFNRLFDDKARCIRVSLILGIAFSIAVLVLSVLLVLGKIDDTAFADLNISCAMFAGIGLGFALERSRTDFQIEEGNWGRKILRFVIGFAVAGLILFVLKPVFNALGIYNAGTRALRYMLVGFWVPVYPMIGKKLGLFVA